MAEKTLNNTCINQASEQVSDLQVWGEGDLFRLISKASSDAEGWMKSTKAMDTGAGSLVQVTTQQRNPDGSYSVAEAVTFAPGIGVVELSAKDTNEVTARSLVPYEAIRAYEEERLAKQQAAAKSEEAEATQE